MDRKDRALTLLVGGLTDAAAAHRLGVSERTVERYVRALMDAAGARNRMQLGRHAALRGLPAYGPDHTPDQAPEPGPGLPDPETGRLLELLLADSGSTVPRSLYLSPRSAERRIRDLMTLAGARSRVQLGWRVTRWGWI